MGSDTKEHGSLRDYVLCLKTNKYFLILWLAEVIDSTGSWLNYISVLTLVEKFSANSSLAVSAVVLIRFLPSLVLAPLCGVVADRQARTAPSHRLPSLEPTASFVPPPSPAVRSLPVPSLLLCPCGLQRLPAPPRT